MKTQSALSVLRRALLYVPSSSEKMLAKSLQTTCDNITYDLEDSVTLGEKAAARQRLAHHLGALRQRPPGVGELAVRINAVSTGLAAHDLAAIKKSPVLDALVVPKVNGASDLKFVADHLRDGSRSESAPRPRLIALIESARAVMDLREICNATPDLDGLIFAAEDFALDLSLTRTPSFTEFLFARSAIVTAARAFNIPNTIDMVCTAYKGPDAESTLRAECLDGKQMGFNGKQCIHPSQISTVQTMFGPSGEEVEWAIRVVIADARASARGQGAWTLDSKMIDAPVIGKAAAIVAAAEKTGFDMAALRNKWQHQQPE